MNYTRIIITLLALLCLKITAQKQEEGFLIKSHKEIGIPPIQNFKWDNNRDFDRPYQIRQHPNGLMYMACKGGITEFDGTNWQLVYKQKKVFNLSISDTGTIYTMTSKDFGVLEEQNSTEGFKFKSLKPYSKLKDPEFGLDLGCYIVNDKVYFVFNKYIFEWNGNKLFEYRAKNFFKSVFKVNNKLYVKESGGDLYSVEKEKLQLQKGTESLPRRALLAGISYNNGLLLADNLGQFYTYQNKVLTPKFKLPDGLSYSSCLFIEINNDQIVVGTKNKGVLFYNYEGELLLAINKSNGLPSNRINDLFMDDQGGVWLTHAKGVTRLEINSPFSFYDDDDGINGVLLAIFRHEGKLYCSSKNELFQLNVSEESTFEGQKFKKIQSFDSSILCSSYKNLLFISSSKGLYVFQDDKVYKLTDTSSTLAIPSSKYKDLIFVSDDFGIQIIKDLGSSISIQQRFKKINYIKLSDVPIQSTNLIEDRSGDIIMNIDFKDLYRIKITSIYDQFEYEKEEILVPKKDNSHNSIQTLNGKLAIQVDGKLMIYDDVSGNFDDHPINNQIDKEIEFVPYLMNQKNLESKMLLSTGVPGQTVIAIPDENQKYHFQKNIFDRYPNYQIWSFYQDKNEIIWFGGSSGLVRFDYNSYQKSKAPPSSIIREIAIGKDSTVFRGILPAKSETKDISYANNSIRLNFAFPYFNNTDENRFAYFLEGYDKDWSKWSTVSEKSFNNLQEGTYSFRLKAQNIYGQESEETTYGFIILPPWYRTWWAYLVFAIGFIAFVMLLVKWRSSQLLKEKNALEAVVKNRTDEVVRKNDQLKLQAEKLKEMDEIKSRFFTNISHEFRTPITLIKGPICDSIKDEENLSLEQKKMINRNTDRLLRLVNQLLDLSKLDSGSLKLHLEEGDLNYFLRVISSSFNSYALQRHIKYLTNISDNVLLAAFDNDKLEKVVYNLLSNAFKYTPDHGEVKFSISTQENQLKLIISDTGKGISKNHLPNIFARFYQIDTSSTRNLGGSGIGLSLTKELITLMKGDIQVDSALGKGTRFTVTIPILIKETYKSKIEPEKTSLSSEKHMSNRIKYDGVLSHEKQRPIILVVEDNDDMRKYIISSLTKRFQVLEAINGLSGLEIAVKKIPDLIITDLMMPQMDGISLCEKIRADEKTCHIPIVMLTAKAQKESKIKGLIEGVDDYLTKPFDREELLIRVTNLINQRQKLRTLYSQQVSLEPKQIAITSIDENFLNGVISYIENNLSDSQFRIKELQQELVMSKTQLHRKMKALTDQAPGEFLRNYRLKRAAQILSNKGENVTQVAFAVGFNSLSYFTKCFKDFYGKSPSEFLKGDEINI